MISDTQSILARLVAFDTVSAISNLGIVAFIEDFLKDRGFNVARLADPTGTKAGLFASIGPQGSGIMLSAHTDVVPVEGQDWTRPPFRLTEEGDRLYGRGTTDMKGFLASMLSLADRVDAGAMKEPLKLAISYDEEVGCVGIAQMIDRLAPLLGQPRACIVGEPTQMIVATGHKGKVALHAKCIGQSGHSALAPNFVNALHLASDFIQAIRDQQQWLSAHGARDSAYDIPYSTLHVGKLQGGTALNIVPDLAELDFELRHLAADAPDAIIARLGRAAEELAEEHRLHWSGVKIEIHETNAYPGLDVPVGSDVVALALSLSGSNQTGKVAFGTEAGFFDRLGIPTIVCGPGSMEGQGHKPDEYIEKAQLAACDRMMDRVRDALT